MDVRRKYSTLEVRLRAVDAVKKGMPVTQAATAFGIDRTTLRRWLARHDQGGDAGLQRLPVPGRPRILAGVTLDKIKSMVLTPATKSNYETDLWTVGRLHAVFIDRFRVEVSEDTVWRRVRQAGLTWQTAERPRQCGNT